jgi:CRISPR-associated protein Cmr6
MGKAAVIEAVAQAAGSFDDAAPGHRFNLYFPIWEEGWSLNTKGKTAALKKCARIPSEVGKLLAGVCARQNRLFEDCPEGLRVEAVSTSPFATGLGNEHPVENGFAFLTPYGLPYLAGSGVKGVLRRAAEELALFPDEYPSAPVGGQLTMLDVWWLFGFEGAAGAWWPSTRNEERELSGGRKLFREHVATLADRPDLPDFICRVFPPGNERMRYLDDPGLFLHRLDDLRYDIHTRGALDFWDVFPQPQGSYKDRLAVEIMTPHFSDYYQRKTSTAYPHGATPHDAGQPKPIPFLAVPAGSRFDFNVVCHEDRLPDALRGRWRPMLETIFAHAFDWLGFGAKTAAGYGQMGEDPDAAGRRAAEDERRREEEERKRQETDRERELAAMSPADRTIADALTGKVDKKMKDSVFLCQLLEKGRWEGELATSVAERVRERMHEEKCWKETSTKPEKDKEYKRTQVVLRFLGHR